MRIQDIFKVLRGGESFYITKEELRDWLNEVLSMRSHHSLEENKHLRKVISKLKQQLNSIEII